MTARFLAGYHAGYNAMGIWLTKPGFDATAVNAESAYLLKPELKVEQVVMSGSVSVPRSNPFQSVFYPLTFTRYPYVFFREHISAGVVEYPHSLSQFGTTSFPEVQAGMSIYQDKISVTNGNDSWDIIVDFVIFHRAIG